MVGAAMIAGDRTASGGGATSGWWAADSNGYGNGGSAGACSRAMESEFIRRHHHHELRENQCSSTLSKHIKAPIHIVWSLVRRFDQPQKYKPFVSRCVVRGDLGIGSVREVNVKSGLPATTSTERLELLDDNEHILSIKIVGGDHRLKGHLMQMTFMVPPTFNKELQYLNKEDRLLRWLVVKHRSNAVYGLDQITEEGGQHGFRMFSDFRKPESGEEDDEDDDDDDEDEDEDEEPELQ